MNKKLVALCLCVAILASALTAGTLAYFTDDDSETNTFTVGNVAIDLIEAQLHRVNANNSGSILDNGDNPAMEGNAEEAPEYAEWEGTYFTDAQIKEYADKYKSDYLKEGTIAPGTGYRKCPYVINTGINDAYIRIRVIIPKELDAALDDSMYTSSAIGTEFTYAKSEKTIDEVVCNVYEFTRIKPLAANEMTFWNVWGSIQMDKDVTNKTITDLKTAGYITDNGTFDVEIEADAIQADGFASATEAWTAFDAE